MKRRTFLYSGVAVGFSVPFAGCTTNPDNSDNNTDTSTPKSSESPPESETKIENETSTNSETETETDDNKSDDSSDTEGPVIDGFSISENQFSPGETMKINVEVFDPNDISRLYFRFENQAGGGAVYDAYRDFSPPVDSGAYTIEYHWPEETSEGTYEATWIYAEDSIGNRAGYADDFPQSKKEIEIDSDTSDTEGPEITDFIISDREFEPEEKMQIEVDVTDKNSIERIYFRFENQDGGGAVYDAYRDFSPPVKSGRYTIEYQWPQDTPGGTYEATWIFAEDNIGNTADWTALFPTEKSQITINSEVSDTNGPVIQNFSISADQFKPSETMQIEVDVTDKTEIERVYFRFEHEDGGGAVYDAYRDFSPPVESGKYTIEYQWPEDTPTGTYQATWIFAEDSIGNKATWTDSFSTQKKQVELKKR